MDIDQLKDDLRRDEGFVSHAYQDSEGWWTIGIGRLIDQRKGGGITEEEARDLLANDIAKVCQQLDAALPWWRGLSEARMRALANMAFQLGISGLLGFRKMLAALQREDWRKAYDEALDSRWAQQTPMRAQRVAKMLLEG